MSLANGLIPVPCRPPPPPFLFYYLEEKKNLPDPKNLKAVQELELSTREKKPTQPANTFLQFKELRTWRDTYLCHSFFFSLLSQPLSSGMETPSLSIHPTSTYFTFITTV